MRGKPGLWAAVRLGAVVHRFNTYGMESGQSTELLRRQLSKQGPRSLVEAVQLSYLGFIKAFKTRDLDQVREWWHRLESATKLGEFPGLQGKLDEFWEATGGGDQAKLKRTLESLNAAVFNLGQ